MQHGAVANGAIGPDQQRMAHIGVQHGIVLHIRPRADPDHLFVAAQDRAEPDIHRLFQHDLADDRGGGRDPRALPDFRGDAIQSVFHRAANSQFRPRTKSDNSG